MVFFVNYIVVGVFGGKGEVIVLVVVFGDVEVVKGDNVVWCVGGNGV